MQNRREPGARPSLVVLSLLGAFLGSLLVAAVLYPGGNWRDASSPGFVFWVNYWCDLMRLEALNGEPNPAGGSIGRAAFVFLGLSSAATFWVAARVLEGRRLARFVRVGGLASGALVMLVGIVSYTEYRVFHAATSMSGGLLGSATALVLELTVWGSGRASRWRKGVDLVFGVLALATAAVYAEVIWRGGSSAVLPVVQKPATLAMVLWMATAAWSSDGTR